MILKCNCHSPVRVFVDVDVDVDVAGGEELLVGVGDNTILQCPEAAHQAVSSVEWFCRSE